MFSGTKAWTETGVILYGNFVQSDMMAWTETGVILDDHCVHSNMEGLIELKPM